jgi:tetratricopeptide (TPR) repeat protein
MKICLAVLWISFAVANPIHGEIEFDQFRQLKIREIQEHLRLDQEDPLDAIEYFNLGLAYMAMGRHRKEIDSYLKAIRIDSNYAKPRLKYSIHPVGLLGQALGVLVLLEFSIDGTDRIQFPHELGLQQRS